MISDAEIKKLEAWGARVVRVNQTFSRDKRANRTSGARREAEHGDGEKAGDSAGVNRTGDNGTHGG